MIRSIGTRNDHGSLVYDAASDTMQLHEVPLNCDDWIEVEVFGYWIPGCVKHDSSGWFILTFDQTEIRLRPSLTARFCNLFSLLAEIAVPFSDEDEDQDGLYVGGKEVEINAEAQVVALHDQMLALSLELYQIHRLRMIHFEQQRELFERQHFLLDRYHKLFT
jgi:hypothetical protein